MISLPLPPETEKLIEQMSKQEKENLTALIQFFVTRTTSTKFPDLALSGPALSNEELELLATEMEADQDFVSEPKAVAYLAQLKSAWSKEKQ
jgi:hypothetical protein